MNINEKKPMIIVIRMVKNVKDDATHLEKRPFLHCTTVPIVLWIFLILLSSVFHSLKLQQASWIVLAAFLSHHIRDGTRRGLWFCPFGSTRPLPYYLYVSLCMSLPYLLYWLSYQHTFAESSSDNVTLIDI
ncbi:transmembrane protein 267 isoform X2 [Harpegnathos saltator]|uniref:Transmembrane protein 267 n=1 Tax=Harpegnathos saltator TaxID=610380 RepID=E2BY69_HARSA|nr:transmembrane protein 267 isoform X2 [Harpegnathos saltator]EFN79348.1 Transmembrane protein C5orf28 [Harpegnathos saltator]